MRPTRFLAIFAPLVALSCSEAPGPLMPRAEVVPEILDLGRIEVDHDKSVAGEFRLRNRGTGTLSILSRTVSCGCTVPDWPPATIPPGGEVVVRLAVTPKREAGAHGSVVSFTTDDPATPTVRVQVRWLEQTAIAFEPKSLDFGRVDGEKPTEATVRVLLSPRIAGHPLNLASHDKNLTYEWMGESAPSRDPDAGRVRLLRVRLGLEHPAGNGSTELRLTIGGSESPAILPITWRTGPPIEATPKSFFHSGVVAAATVRNRLVLRSADGSEFEVRKFEVDGVAVDCRPDLAGKESGGKHRVIEFTVKAGASAGIERHTAKLTLSGGGAPLVVPVTLVVK